MNINGAMFLFITNMTFSNMFSVINVFCMELPIFLREHFNGMYRTDTYFLAKQIAELPVVLLAPAIFLGIMYYMVGLNAEFVKFAMALAIIELMVQVVISFGKLSSSSLTVPPAALCRLHDLLPRQLPGDGLGPWAASTHPSHALWRPLPQ